MNPKQDKNPILNPSDDPNRDRLLSERGPAQPLNPQPGRISQEDAQKQPPPSDPDDPTS